VDVETPKIADCGIARVEGLQLLTVQAMTRGYGAPEQSLSVVRPTDQNPLVGPWSDVHALAATIFFVIAGEEWCRSGPAWNAGERRRLRTSGRLHRGFLAEGDLLEVLDGALRTGASPKLPPGTWDRKGASFVRAARAPPLRCVGVRRRAGAVCERRRARRSDLAAARGGSSGGDVRTTSR